MGEEARSARHRSEPKAMAGGRADEVADNLMHVARQLRKSQTSWEIKFWNAARNRQIAGLKFRRQTKIGKYIVDFLCLEKKLIIELDGGQHNLEQNIAEDKIRQNFLKREGYKILRFWNNDVENNLDGVVQTIIQSS